MECEIWLPVPGYEGLYEVSDLGRVYSYARQGSPGRVLTPKREVNGYIEVSLYRGSDDGKRIRKRKSVHRLVLEAFAGPCPDGMEACHGPNGVEDNSLANLYWGTHVRNCADMYRDGTVLLGERNHQAKLTDEDVCEIRRLYAAGDWLQRELAERYGVTQGNVSMIVRGVRRGAGHQ